MSRSSVLCCGTTLRVSEAYGSTVGLREAGAGEKMAKMRALEHSGNSEAGLEPTLVELVRLRVSEMNG